MTRPQIIINKIIDEILDKKNIAFFVPDDLPWRHVFRDCLYDNTKNKEFKITFIDVEKDIDLKKALECKQELDITIGDYIINNYSDTEKDNTYRKGNGSIQDYIVEHNILNKKVLCFRSMTQDQEKSLLNFCKKFKKVDSHGFFILELRWIKEKAIANFSTIDFQEGVNENDLWLFNAVILELESENTYNYSAYWKRYIAYLCSELCVFDAELSAHLMRSYDFQKKEPLDILKSVVRENDDRFKIRGRFDENHVLWSARNDNNEEKKNSIIHNRIWKAQLKGLFPMVEEERVSFIDCFKEDLIDALNTEYYEYNKQSEKYELRKDIEQFHKKIEDPYDLELGTISYMLNLRKDKNGHIFLIKLPDDSRRIRDRLHLIYDLRNALAHHKSCTVDDIASFFESYPFSWFSKKSS